MKKLFIFFLLLCSFVSYSQTWEEYSDSIYSFQQSGNWEDAYKLIEIADELLVTYGYKEDTVYADYLYRKGVLQNAIAEDYTSSLNNILLAKEIWDNSNFYNPRKFMLMNLWIAKSYNTNLKFSDRDTSSDAFDLKMSDQYFLESIRINIEHDTILWQTLLESYETLSYNNFPQGKVSTWNDDDFIACDKVEKYGLLELYITEKYARSSRGYHAQLYDIYRRFTICHEDGVISEQLADYYFKAVYYLALLGGQDDDYFFKLVGRCGLMYRQLTDLDEYGNKRSRAVFDFADSVCNHDNWLYYTTILYGRKVSSASDVEAIDLEFETLDWLKHHRGDSSRYTINQYTKIAQRYKWQDNPIKSIEYYEKAIMEADKYKCIHDTLLADWHLELFKIFDVDIGDNIRADLHSRRYLELRDNNRNDDFYYIKVRLLIEEFKYKEAVDIVMNNDIMKTMKDELLALQTYVNVMDLFQRGHLSSKDCSSLIKKSRNIIAKSKHRFDGLTLTEVQLVSFLLDMYEYNLQGDSWVNNEMIEKAENFIRDVDPDKRNVLVVDFLILMYSSEVSYQDRLIELAEEKLKRYDQYDIQRLDIYYAILRNYYTNPDALKYLTPAKEILRRYDLEFTEDAISFKYFEHEIALRNGDYVESKRILAECFEILSSTPVSKLKDYRKYLKILLDLSVSTNDYSEQIRYLDIADEIIDYYGKYIDDSDMIYHDYYRYKGLNLLYKKPLELESAKGATIFFEKCLKLLEEHDVHLRDKFGEIYYWLSKSVGIHSLYFHDVALDEKEAIRLAYESEDYMRKSQEYGNRSAQEYISEMEFDWNKSEASFQKKMNFLSKKEQDINTRSLFLSDNEKSLLISDNIDDYEWINSFLLTNDMSKDYLIGLINRRSFIRSFLLESSNKRLFEKVNETGDRILMSQLEELTNKREDLFTALDMGKSNDDIDILNKEIISLEKLIVNYFYNTASENTNLTAYELIKDNVSDNECYVEIIRINRIDETFLTRYTDSIFYAAIIISKDNDPELILLDNQNIFEDKLLPFYSSFVKDDYNNIDKKSYDFFMKKIIDKVGYDKTIFLSPDGIYNNVSIATLFDVTKGQYLLETTDIRIVSSARGFVSNKTADPRVYKKNNIEIIGNPKFDLSKSEATFTNDETYVSRDVEISNFEKLTRFGISQLPGTGIEINDIKNLFENNNWSVSLAESVLANETRIKKVNSPRVMHIATHGFFFPKQENEYDPISQLMGLEINKTYEHPLMRSGLLLSGAQNTIRGENLVGDNGVLTSLEARELNLSETELVVLSACETGVGDFVSGEGVYGLQRSILEAGAENVIMSLWKVDDIATQMLMTTFYANWIEKGMTKREALKQSQMTIKNTEGYSSPYYWGAFVLIGK